MKFHPEDEEDMKKTRDKLDKIVDCLIEKAGVKKEDIPDLKRYLNEELLELHYCRKGTEIRIKTEDPFTKKIMISDVIGHLLAEIPEEDRNDVLLMAIHTSGLDNLIN